MSEITEKEEEDEDEEVSKFIDPEDQRERIRQILRYQKSAYSSSSSSSSSLSSSASASSSSSSSSSSRSNSLLGLMKAGNTSLRRLFDMQHTSLATYFDRYSGSPMIKPIPLWGSDSDPEICDVWASIKIGLSHDSGSKRANCTSNGSFVDGKIGSQDSSIRVFKHKLSRKKSFRRLPRFGMLWCNGRFRVRLKLRRLRIMICGKVF